jgi:predicted enzyme related to lactoylglutathione lyase
MGQPVVHFEIYGKDEKKLQQFYSELLGWKVDANNPVNYGLVDTGGGRGINGGIAHSEPGTPSVTIYIEVDDLQAYLDKAVKMGSRILVPVTEIPGMVTYALFSDPEGNAVGLVKGLKVEG